MEAFLTTTIDNLKERRYNNLTIVLGNESCDLDSAVSAVVYAAYLYWQYNQIKCKVCTRSHRDESQPQYQDDIFVPILNVARSEFELKTEVVYCLKEHGLDDSKLVFKDDIDLRQLVTKPKTAVTLVDHHVLAKNDEYLANLVTEIIDHRPIDREAWKYPQDTRSSIELVGSCCSLVAQRIQRLSALVANETDFFNAFPDAADLLLCGIILDTVNFSKEVNKATPTDRAMASLIESVLKPERADEERKSKLDKLVSARKDVSGLSAAQLLRKDVKIAGDFLVPSFPILVKEFLQRPNCLQAIIEAMTSNKCSVTLLLGMSLSEGLQRDVGIYCGDMDIAKEFSKFLTEWRVPPLQLEHKDININDIIYFKQLNLSASRKQYMPAVVSFQDFINKKSK